MKNVPDTSVIFGTSRRDRLRDKRLKSVDVFGLDRHIKQDRKQDQTSLLLPIVNCMNDRTAGVVLSGRGRIGSEGIVAYVADKLIPIPSLHLSCWVSHYTA